MCSRHRWVRPLWICPSKRVSISPEPQRLRLVADGSGSPAVCMSVCWISQAISPADACLAASALAARRSEEHTSELQSQSNLVCRLLLEKKKNKGEQELYIAASRTLDLLDVPSFDDSQRART